MKNLFTTKSKEFKSLFLNGILICPELSQCRKRRRSSVRRRLTEMSDCNSTRCPAGTCVRLSTPSSSSNDRLRLPHQTRIVRAHIHYSRDINSTRTATTAARKSEGTDGDNKGTFGWPLSSWSVGGARALVVSRTDDPATVLSTTSLHSNMHRSSSIPLVHIPRDRGEGKGESEHTVFAKGHLIRR